MSSVFKPLIAAALLVAICPECHAQAGEPGNGAAGLYTALERFHGHVCGGSLMGARMGLAARAALDQAGGAGKYQARIFSQSCPVDGVQVAAGSTCGNRAIEVEDRDELRLILADGKSGREVEARVTAAAAEKAGASRDLSRRARALPLDSPERLRLEQQVEAIFIWLKTAAESEVVTVKSVR